jgi:hypothetical protein
MVVVAGTRLSSIHLVSWLVLNLQMIASRSPLRPGYGRSGHIDVDWVELLEEECLLFAAASLLRGLEAVAPDVADSLLWPGETLFLVGWCR